MDNILNFENFTRTGLKMLMCLHSFSGGGKTWSAIEIAKGLGGKTCFLDTETGRAKMYAEHAPGFTYAELTPQFTPERYIAAIKQIEAAKFDNLIIDSASHEWEGLGGLLEIADASTTRGLGKWKVPKSRHKKFVNTLLASRMNIIICLRSKEKLKEVVVNGAKEYVSDGYFPVQEKGFKFDMIVQLQMMGDGRYICEKAPGDLRHAFPSGEHQISEETGRAIKAWLSKAAAPDEALDALKLQAEEYASTGTAALKSFFEGLKREQKARLQPYLGNLKSIAATADQERDVEREEEGGADLSDLKGEPEAA